MSEFKKGQSVKFTTQRGNAGKGVIKSIDTPAGNGKFYRVARDGSGKNDPLVSLRASQLAAA